MGKKIGIGCGIAAVIGVLILFMMVSGTYNTLNKMDQAVLAQWAQVENSYQRRLDLIPNLVETVKGAAAFEKETFTEIAEARASVGKITPEAMGGILNDPAAFERFQQAQGALTQALSRIMAVVENYPELKANANFQQLQQQLEGTENRISVERMRFNELARDFNTKRLSFPTVIIAGFFGDRFREKPFFKADAGANKAPGVKF